MAPGRKEGGEGRGLLKNERLPTTLGVVGRTRYGSWGAREKTPNFGESGSEEKWEYFVGR